MARIDAELEPRDVADQWPRKVRCRHCGHKFTAYTKAQAEGLRTVGCISCVRKKMRQAADSDRRPLPDAGRRGR